MLYFKINIFFFVRAALKSCISLFLLFALNYPLKAQGFIDSYSLRPLFGDAAAHIVTDDENIYVHVASVVQDSFEYVQGGLIKLDNAGDLIWENEWKFAFGNVGTSFSNGIVLKGDTVYTTGNYLNLVTKVFSPAIIANSTATGEFRPIRFPYDHRASIHDIYCNDGNTFTTVSEDWTSDSFHFTNIVDEIDLSGNSSSSMEYLTEFSVTAATNTARDDNDNLYIAHIGCFGEDATCYPFQGWLSKVNADGSFAWNRSYGYTVNNQEVLPKVTVVNDTTIAYAWTKDTNNLSIQESPPIIYFLDTLGNIRKSYAFHGNWRVLSKLFTCANGDVVGVGDAWTDIGYTGWMFRLDANANLLWERYVQDHRQSTSSVTDLNAVTEAPDGSIIAGGNIFHPQPPRDNGARLRAWIVKLDANGCYEPGCTSDTIYLEFPNSIAQPDIAPESEVKVYPNPTADVLNWSVADLPVFRNLTDYRITNTAGYWVRNAPLGRGQQSIDVRDLPVGVYFLNLLKDGHIRGVKRFVKR